MDIVWILYSDAIQYSPISIVIVIVVVFSIVSVSVFQYHCSLALALVNVADLIDVSKN